jgi:V/A-type H+-transporting ATPase subunit I
MVANLKKFIICATKKYQNEILDYLQNIGIVQIITFSSEKILPTDFDYNLAQLKFALDFISSFEEKKNRNLKQSVQSFLFPKIIISQEEINKQLSGFNWLEIIEKAKKCQINLNEFTNKIKSLKEEKEKIFFLKNLDFNLNEISKIDNLDFLVGKISQKQWLEILVILEKELPLTIVKKIFENQKNVYFLLIYDKSIELEIEKLKEKYKVEKIEINFSQSPKEYYEKIEKELEQFNEKLIETKKEALDLTNYYDKLKIVFDFMSWEKEKELIKNSLQETDFVFSIIGWVEEEKFPLLKENLEKITKEIEIREIAIKEGETVPVLLKNKGLAKYCEVVTNLYGLPLYSEPDPTPFLTPFFILFFAICLSDAGYGLVLALISFLIIKFFDLPKKDFFKLMMILGLATFFVGALFGSWFGIDLETLPEFLKPVRDLLIKIKIVDSVKNPLPLLVFSLYLGAIHIIFGLMIKFYWKLKQKKIGEAFLDDFPWIFLLTSILVFILIKTKVLLFPEKIINIIVLMAAAFVVLTQGRKQKNVFLKIPSGIYSLYGLISYFSDTLSYSRLLALGLATGIIAMVINLVVKIFMTMFPGIGIFVAILVLIFGHLFNIAINALGSFIHSARLQFVEFFPKFLEGGGQRFRFFKKEGKYIEISQ